MKDKKGLSQVVSIVIIIVLVLIAAGILWGVASNLFSQGTTQAGITSKCLNIEVSPTKADCWDTSANGIKDTCNVTVERTSTGDALDAIRIIFANDEESNSTQIDGNVGPSETKTFYNEQFTLTGNLTKVKVIALLKDDEGNLVACPNVEERTI